MLWQGAVADFGNGPVDLDIREGEAPAEPLSDRQMRLGRSLALPI